MVFWMWYTFKDQIGSVALFLPPSSSPVGRDSEQLPRRGSIFHVPQQVCRKKSQVLEQTTFSLIASAGFFCREASHFAIQSEDHSEKPHKPFGRSLASMQPHLNSILMAEHGISKGAVNFPRSPGPGEYPPARVEYFFFVFPSLS